MEGLGLLASLVYVTEIKFKRCDDEIRSKSKQKELALSRGKICIQLS